MKYKVIVENIKSDLEKEVQQKIDEGWEPIGGISVATVPSTIMPGSVTKEFAQAVIKKDA